MKKRLLSALLALSMFFSIVPSSLAYTGYNGSSFDTYSPISGLAIDVDATGQVTSVKVKPNADLPSGNFIVSMYTTTKVMYDAFMGEDGYSGAPEQIVDTYHDTNYTSTTETGQVDLPRVKYMGSVAANGGEQALSSVYNDDKLSVQGIIDRQTAQGGARFTEPTEDDDDYSYAMMYCDDDANLITDAEGLATYIAEKGGYTVDIIVFNDSQPQGSSRAFYATAVIKQGEATKIRIPAESTDPDPGPTQEYVGDVTVSITDPVVGVAPSASGTASGENAGTSATVAWDTTTNALTLNGKFDANKVYKANVTVNATDDAEFKAGSKVTVNGTAITLTDEMISSDKKNATVEYTPAATDKLKVTSVTASGNLTKNEYKPDESFNASGLKATITYNNGEQVTDIDVTNNNYGVFAALAENAQDASSDSNGATLALDSPKNVFIVYNHAEDSTSTDIDATGGLVKSTIAATITVANAKITTAQVSVTYPKPGETPDTVATVPSDANYTAEVTWQDSDGADVSGNFEYDKAYNAIITVKPNTGYALDNTNGVVLTVKDKTAANPGADKPATIVSDDIDVDGSGVKTVSFDATTSTPISASITDSFDLYDKNDVNITLTLGTHVIGDITGIKIDGQTLSSSDDYTISGNIITVKGTSLATKLTGLTSTAANKNVEITVTGQQNATTATLSAIDTTPYITITDPTQGAITGVTHTSGTKVALTKNTAYTLSAPTVAHTTGYTWTVSGITGTDNGQTYTFTPTGGEDITATVALTVDAGHKLTITKTGNGTVTVAKDGGSTLTAESDGTYTVYSDERYTVTATADDQNKVTAVTGETISGVQKTVTHSVANPSADTTVEVTFAEKIAPTVSADMTYRKGANDGNKAFTITLGDYSEVTVSGTPRGTLSTDKATYTVSSTDLDSATNGDHTYTFSFGEGKTLTAKITVLAARSITGVTAPTGTFAHGDTFKLDGLAFTVSEDRTNTTYTYDGTSWDNTLPTGTQFSLDGTSFSDWDAFKAAAESKITRHDTTDSTAVNNGDQITVSLGNGVTGASGTISVGQKAITVTPSQTTDINKDYDGTVKAPALTATIADGELVTGDDVTASVTAVYKDNSGSLSDSAASDNDKNVVFTPTLNGANKDNYTIKAIANGSGKINKRTVKIAIINNVPAATKNKADTKTGHATAIIPTNTEYEDAADTLHHVVDGETVEITYDYSYANISRVGPVSDVTVTNIATTNTNYTVEPTYLENQNGTVNNRTIESIAISDPTKNEYNYSDIFDPAGIKVTVKYDGETDSVDYDWNNVPDDITLKWTETGEALSANHKFNSVGTGTYTITASATGVEPATTNDITVNKLKVNVTASGTITKVYDGDGALDDDDADGITYTVTNASDGYEDQFNADNVTVSSQSVTYKDSLVGNVGVWISNCESDNPNYKVNSVKNQVNATITKRPITVTAITVPTVKQYSNDTDVPVENVGTSAVTFDNVVSGENVTVDYKYTYNDTSVAGDTSNITINNLVLNSTNTVNNNYTLDESTPTKSGHVDERTVNSLTVTAPTQFATAQTYGTALALAGLKVQVNFTSGGTSAGSETYVWKDASTWTKQVEGQSDVDVTTVPFTLAWSGTTDVPTQGETLNVQRNTKGITASYTGTSVTGTSDAITVNPITLTKIKITGDDVTKVYEGNKTLTNPAFTYAITEGIINSDPVTVEPTTVEYAEADVHTSKPLNITGFHLTSDNNGNYTLGTPNVTGTPNGTITKRPITLTAITNIPAINRFEAGTGTDQTATSAANGGATFEAAGTDTGIVSGETVTVIYDYAYADNQTVSNRADVNLSNVRLDTASDKNYSLTNNATATGVVYEVEATGVTVTIPDKTYEYGDKLDLTGTTVTVDYGNTNTEVYTSDDGVNWKKNDTAVSEKPFTITLPTNKDSLAVGIATVSVKVKDGVENSVSRTVNKRKVTVTPSKNGDVTKVYDGNTTYTNGVIEWTVESVNSIDGLTVTLPTVSSATYTYNASAVAAANEITVSGPTLSDTNNFEISGYAVQEFDAKITLRPLVITGITIPDVNKYADVSQKVTGQTATSATNATFEAADTDTGIVSGETVGVTFDYKYKTSNPESGTTTDVDITNIALDNSVGTSANYSLTPNLLTGSANVVERTIDSITVDNPTQFNSDVTYNDKLSIAGLKVTINYTDRTSEVYTATVVSDVVSWALGSVNISADNIPFTLSWKDNAKGGTFAQGQTLSVTGHNGNQIVANHKNGNDSGEGSAVTIKPIAITSITAAKSGDITKTYNGDTELNDASKSNIGYTSTQVISGDTVTLGATPAYENKNVGQNKAISFTTPTVSGNDNYTLGTGATVTGDVVGDITVKTVAISNVYIPSIYKDTEDLVKSISNASAIASGNPTANTVVAADILSGDRANLTFDYKLTYANSTDDNPTVTISDTSVTGTESGNYEFTWPTGLTGTVVADEFTDAAITSPDLMQYTHGDTFNPTGLSVTIKTSSHPTGTTYTVTGTEGNYKWDTDLPAGVNVSLGSISLNSNDALNFKAHYNNMKDQKIKVSAGEKEAETGVVKILQKQLTATASISTAKKVYDSKTALREGQTVTYTIGTGEVQSFNSVTDDVKVTADANYKSADVSKTGETINNVGIEFTNIALSGNDAANYIKPSSIADIEGKINPYTINITKINETAPTAYYKQAKSGDIESTTNYDADMNGLTKPAIKFNYNYGNLVNTVANSVNVPISGVGFVTATDNFEIKDTPPTIKGNVEVQGIKEITINKNKRDYKYGNILDLTDLSVKVTYADNSIKENIRYDDTDWQTLGLTLNTTLPTDGTVLKNSTDNGKTITVKKDTVQSNAITINVAKRTVKIERDGSDAITKTYDGTQAVEQTIALKVADSQEGFDGVYNGDITGVTASTYIYSSKDAQNNIALTGTPTLGGSNLDEYTPTYPSLTGNITKKSVTLTPVIEDIYENKFATADKVITETDAKVANGKVTQSGIVSGEEGNFTFAYTVTVPKADLASAATKSYAPTNTSENGTGKGNYTFTWNDASVEIKTNAATSMAVTTDPTDISNQKYYGDSISLDGMVVTITYGNGSTHEFTYDSAEWNNEGFTVAIEDGGDFSKLVTGNNGKHIVVSKAGLDSANTNATLKVNKKNLQLTAEKADGLSAIEKTYDTTTDAKSILKFGITSTDLVSGDSITVDSSNVSATFDNKNQGSDKDITISGLTITGDNSDQYNVIMPSGVQGKINSKSITVTVTSVADILAGVSGDDLKKTASINYSEQPESGVSVTVTATYPDSTQDPAGQKTEKTLTFTKTETGNELGNYVFTLDENGVKGYVVSNIINEINVTTPPQTEYTHGDNLSLKGMVIEVKYQDSRDDNIYTCQADGTWKDKNSITVTELPVSFALEKNGTENALTSQTQQLRRDTNNGAILVVKGGDESNKNTTLTVNKKEITQITIPTTPSPEKTYDGTTTVTQSISYVGVGVLDADKATVNSLISATANYDTKDVAFDSDGTTVASKAINFTNPTMTENDNYTMSSSATVTTTITGKIKPKDLTVRITSVPSIIVGQSKTVTLTKTTNYTQSGEVTVGENTEEVNLAVVGEYAQNTTAEDNVNVTYSVTNKDSYKNYNIIVAENPTGTVNKKPVTKIEVTSPTKTTWSHGDALTLDGMTITVTYNNDNTDTKKYEHKNGKWYDITGGSNTELLGTPDDVAITWDGTNSATDGVIRLDDTNKGLTANGDNKTTSVKVTSTVKDTNGEYQSASTGDITLTKKQLTLTVSGNVEKPYDKTNDLISGNNVTLTLAGVAGTDGVALNETATKNNIKYAGTTVAETASSPSLVIGTVVLNDSDNNQYYTVPSGASITNSTTGKINKRPVQITSVTKNMDTSVDASTTGTLEKLVQSPTDGYGISSASGFYSILSDHEIKVDIPYTYSQTSAEGSATVTYDNANAKVSDENADYVANYEVSFAIADGSATISNGTVTGVKIETTGKTEYTHGDSFDLTGTKITVTYNNGAKQDTYEYDTESGKWIKNGTGTPAELPSEIGISLGNTTINANPASDTDKTVVKYDKTNTTPELKATYTKSGSEPISSTENPTVTLKKKTITITVANSADEIKHTYSGNNSLTANEISKLTITEPTNFKVGSDDVTLTKGTLSATIGSNTNGNVDKNLAISVSGYELSGNDADKYEIKYVSTATGDITKAPLTITISSVPSINAGATELKKTLTNGVNYTQSGEVTVNGNKETVSLNVQGTYPNSTYTGGSADKDITYTVTNENDYPNYDITIIGSPKGTVTQKTATVEIINQPQFVTATPRPQHGDKLGTDGLNGFEYTVSYSDGTTTKHKYANGDWLTTGGYTAPEDGTAFIWKNTDTAVSSDSEIRKDMYNKIKITVPTATNEAFTNEATADKKKVKITANGTYTKVYDGTNTVTLNETTPEITYTVSDVATGDTVTVTATPAFVDENVAKFGDVYQKAINFTNVSISNTDNYEIKADENENNITPIMGAITPKTINITALTVPSSTKGSAGEKTVTKNKNFTTTDILEKDKDNVTIGYKATFVTSATGTVDATVTDAKVDGSTDQMTLNYVVGTVTGAKIEITSSNPGGGGGGGGGGNSLSIKYENADGTAGKDVSKIEAPVGSDPVDLIAVFVTKPANPTVIWTSDNESVATVDENGIVKFIGEGTAIITAQSKTNKTLKDTVTITVTKAVATPTPKPANPTPEPTKEPSIITKTMLNPYIVGYDDNVFGPELPISREEVSAIFARLIANNIYMDKEYDTSFPDVGEGWSKDYIGYLEKFSVVTGYEDGTFRPQNYITRAEMAVMMAKAEGYDISGYMSSDELAYPDVDEGYSEWAVKAIKYLTDRGIMEGYPDGTFGPNRPITRAETVATVNRVLADMTVGNIEVLPSDMTEAHWAYNDVVFAMNHRILKDVAADESQFIKSEEYDKNKITETEVVEDTSDENAGAGASPTPEPSPTPNA